ncbi:MAG: hypothetical protein ACXVJN_21345 [Mucilaginibacter sp.]
MSWTIKEYSINSIYLDIKNIRLPITETAQDAIMHDLFSNEDALEIAKSIVRYGMFPDEFPIITKEKGKLIVIEGNRRLAALKGLDNPNRVPLFKDKLRALSNPGIQKIKAVIAPSRDAATQLIANKHTINLRRAWKPLRQAYFYKSQIDNGKTIDQLKEEYPEHEIQKFIKMLEAHHLAKAISYEDDTTTLTVHDERSFPITNLERMYDDTKVLDYLGISFDKNGKISINTKEDEFKKAYKRIVEDIAKNDLNSRNTNNKEQREKYIQNLPEDLKPTKATVSSSSESFKETKIDKANLRRNIKKNKKQSGLIPDFMEFKLNNSSLQTLFIELQDIPVAEFPNAAHDLLRSFLECTLAYYLKNSGEYSSVDKKNNSYNPGLKEMLNFISSAKCTSIKDDNVKQVATHLTTDYAHPYSLARFNMINHNENWVSHEGEVRAAWSKIEELMKYLLIEQSNA